jgi:hypothetical protein
MGRWGGRIALNFEIRLATHCGRVRIAKPSAGLLVSASCEKKLRIAVALLSASPSHPSPAMRSTVWACVVALVICADICVDTSEVVCRRWRMQVISLRDLLGRSRDRKELPFSTYGKIGGGA